MRTAMIYHRGSLAGTLVEDENGYTFSYDSDYLNSGGSEAISLTLPLSNKPYNNSN